MKNARMDILRGNRCTLKNKVNLFLIIVLLGLRIIFVNVTSLFFPSSFYLSALSFELATYLIIFILTWINSENLGFFHIDKPSIIIIILFSTILRIHSTDNPPILGFILGFWGISFGMLVILIKRWSSLRRLDFEWVGVGLLFGIGLPLIFIIIRSLLTNIFLQPDTLFSFTSVYLFLMYILINMGHASIQEDTVFFGFLWGTLRIFGWKEKWIWLFQAFLFTLAHLYFIIKNPTYGLFLPIICLAFGWLAWRSRSITPSMISHSIYDSIIATVRYLLA